MGGRRQSPTRQLTNSLTNSANSPTRQLGKCVRIDPEERSMPFPGTGKIWMNGKLVAWKDATIHIASHVIHYGSGVFEGARCYATPKGSACFRLGPHMQRLINSGKIYRMEYPLDLQGWEHAVLETIRANNFKSCYIRPLVYRGYETLGVNPLTCPVDACILLWDWGTYLGQDAL